MKKEVQVLGEGEETPTGWIIFYSKTEKKRRGICMKEIRGASEEGRKIRHVPLVPLQKEGKETTSST